MVNQILIVNFVSYMAFHSKHLYVRKSSLPSGGKGLFTRKKIRKGSRIIEYKGRLTSWKEASHRNGANGYIFYINRKHVLDAATYPKALGRYANDARGLSRKKGLSNNASYEPVGVQVFIDAVKDIPAGAEILVGYGKEYWDAIRHNKKISDEK